MLKDFLELLDTSKNYLKIYNYKESLKHAFNFLEDVAVSKVGYYLIFNSCFTELIVLKYCKIFKLFGNLLSQFKVASNYRCFCNPVYSASLCLIPHFVAVFVSHKMCLVAQFGKWLLRITFFFGINAFDVNIGRKSHCRVPRVIKKLAFSFTC